MPASLRTYLSTLAGRGDGRLTLGLEFEPLHPTLAGRFVHGKPPMEKLGAGRDTPALAGKIEPLSLADAHRFLEHEILPEDMT